MVSTKQAKAAKAAPHCASSLQIALLDVELVALCLCFLPAHHQARAVSSCKMFAVLLCESQAQTTFLLSSTTTNDTDPLHELAPRLQSPPTAGIFFANSGRAQTKKSVTKLVRSLPPALHLVGSEVDTLVGTTSDGELKVCDTSGFSITLGAFPEAVVGSFTIDISSILASAPADINEHIQTLLEPQDVLRAGWKVMVVMSCGAGSNLLDVLLPQLQTAHPDAAIVGGIVTGRWLLRAHAHKVEFLKHGVVGLMFRGNVPLTALVSRQDDPGPQLARASGELQSSGKALLGGLLFTCTGRDCAADAAAFSDVFPQKPLAGMPSNGEIGPAAEESESGSATQVGRVALQGYTAVYGLFSVPVRSRCPPLPFSDVATAYKESRERPAAMPAAVAAAAAASLDFTEDVAESEESDDSYSGFDSESQDDEDIA